MPISHTKSRFTISLPSDLAEQIELRCHEGKTKPSQYIQACIETVEQRYTTEQRLTMMSAQIEQLTELVRAVLVKRGASEDVLSTGTRHTAEDYYGLGTTEHGAVREAPQRVPASTPGLRLTASEHTAADGAEVVVPVHATSPTTSSPVCLPQRKRGLVAWLLGRA